MFSLERLRTLKLVDIIQPKIVRFVWSAILDDRVCELCRSLDGKVMDANSKEYTIYKSPIHPHCRCTQIPITSNAEIIPEQDFKKPSNDWIVRYAPFWFLIPFIGKKKEPIEVIPEEFNIPEPKVDAKEILVINNIENTKEKVKDYLVNNIILIVFVGSRGETILETEFSIDDSMDFTIREEKLIREKAKNYVMNNLFEAADDWEHDLKRKFGLKNKF